MTEIQKRHSEADITEWHRLKSIVRRNKESVDEWLNAVLMIKTSGLWVCDGHKTWEAFCEIELGLNASTVWRRLQADKSPVQTQGKLPSPSTADRTELRWHCDRMAKRLKTFTVDYVKSTDAWPEDGMSQAALREFDDELFRWCDQFEKWMLHYGCSVAATERLSGRILSRTKRKRKKV